MKKSRDTDRASTPPKPSPGPGRRASGLPGGSGGPGGAAAARAAPGPGPVRLGEERMTAMDAAWLRLDKPSSRMAILGVWLLRPAITLEALRARVTDRLLRHDRFRQRVVDDEQGPRWVEDKGFDLDRHVVRDALPRRRGQTLDQALQARVAAVAAEPLDPAHPLWRLHLVEDHDGGSALLARVHHCIADGIALIGVILSITDDAAAAPPPPDRAVARAGRPAAASPSVTADAVDATDPARVLPGSGQEPDPWADAFLKPISDWTVRALQQQALAHRRPAAGDGSTTPGGDGRGDAAGRRRRRGEAAAPPDGDVESQAAEFLSARLSADMAALAFIEDDSPTRLKGRPGVAKCAAWGQGVPLDAVKAVSKSLGVSVNDVLMSCVAGAIGAYLRAHGDRTDGQAIRAMVPVNLRPMEEAWQLGNRFGVVPLVLPIGLSNPVQRLYAVHARMNELKSSLQPVLAFGLMAAAGLLKPDQQALLNDFQRKATAVMTNVPGPSQPLRFCGATVERVMFWVPQSGDVGVGVSLLTYAGQVQFGLLTDAGLCPDPQAIVDAFEPEFQRLLTLALMLPWEAGH